MHRLWLYVGSHDKNGAVEIRRIACYECRGNPHVYDKLKASSKDEIMKKSSWLSAGENLKSDRKQRMFFRDVG